MAPPQLTRVRPDLEDGEEPHDRRHEHQVEDVQAVGVVHRQGVGVADPDPWVDRGGPLEYPRDRRSRRAGQVQRWSLRGYVESGVHVLRVDRAKRGRKRRVRVEVELGSGDPLDGVDRAGVRVPGANDRGVDVAGDRIAERERVCRDEH